MGNLLRVCYGLDPKQLGKFLGERRNAARQTFISDLLKPRKPLETSAAPGRPAVLDAPAGLPIPEDRGVAPCHGGALAPGELTGPRFRPLSSPERPAAPGCTTQPGAASQASDPLGRPSRLGCAPVPKRQGTGPRGSAGRVNGGPPEPIQQPFTDRLPCQFDHAEDALTAPLSLILRIQQVNPLSSNAFREAERSLPASKKVDNARRWLSGVLQDLGDPWLERRGKAMAECGTRWVVAISTANPSASRPTPVDHCRDRLCPACARIRAQKWAERTTPLLEAVRAAGGVPKMLTLTQVTKPGEPLMRARQRFERAFRRFYRDPRFRSRVRGWMASREVTWSGDAWHYHAHVLIECDYWPQKDIAALWLELTGDSSIVDIRAAKAGSEREIVKYAVKVLTVPPEKLPELAAVLRGARMVSTGGSWRNAVRESELEPTDEAPDGFELWTPHKLVSEMRRGNPTAILAVDACLRWVQERAGRAGHRWICDAIEAGLDPGGGPLRVPRADELEKLTGGALESRGGGWVRHA